MAGEAVPSLGTMPQIVAFDNEDFLGDHTHIFGNMKDLGKWGNSCSGLRTGPLGLANTGACGPAIGAKTRPLGPTLMANEPTLICEGPANTSVDQHPVRTGAGQIP
jgi:hypothetical protein